MSFHVSAARVAAIAGVLAAAAPAAALSVNAVILDDDQAPGFAPGTAFRTTNAGAAVNDLGQVAFFGFAEVGSPERGVFFGTDRSLPAQAGLIAQEGDPVLGGANGLTLNLSNNTLALDNSGRVVIETRLAGNVTSATNDALVEDSLSGGPTTIVQRSGDALNPGSSTKIEGLLSTSSAPVINNAGDTAFAAIMSVPDPTPNDPDRRDSGRGYVVDDGTTATIVDGGDPFGPWSGIGNSYGIDIADNGNRIYRVDQQAQPRPQIVLNGTVVAKADDTVVIDGKTYTLRDVSNPKTNDNGQVLFRAQLEGEDVDTSNDEVLVLDGQVILRQGDTLPSGGVFDRSLRTYSLANDGTIVFAVEDGPGNISTAPWGLYYRPAGGTIQSIFATGDSIEYRPGEVGTVTRLRFLDSGLSTSGEWAAFSAQFTVSETTNVASRGVLRVNLQPIPLPAAGWALLAGLGALVALRRRA